MKLHILFSFFLAACFVYPGQVAAQDEDGLFPMGLPDEPDELYESFDVKATLTEENFRNIGSRASLKQYSPTPRSQGRYGTCAAWAAAFAARTILEARRNGWVDKQTINQHVYSAGFNYRNSANHANCSGAFLSTCIENLQKTGVPKYEDYKLPCPPATMPSSAYREAAKHKIQGHARLWESYSNISDKRKIELIKKSVSEGNPVVFAMYCPKSFHAVRSEVWNPNPAEIQNPQSFTHMHGRHAMCVVGYDDNKYGGAVEVQNSWGSSWGSGGYVWIRYKDFASLVFQAIELMQFQVPPSQDVLLSGALRLQLDTRQNMAVTYNSPKGAYRTRTAYRSGTRFRIYISNNEPAFVYAFGTDNTNKLYTVFPHERGVSAALPYKKNDVALPSESKHVRMDNTVGTDQLCLLYSKEPLNIDDIQRRLRLQNNRLTLRQKLEAVLGNQLMNQNQVNYSVSGGRMSFSGKAKGKTVALLIVEIEHIE